MPEIRYRLFFNNTPATREALDRVEEISVEQEVDMAWEASLDIPICLDNKGKWTKDDEYFMKSFSRVRVEIKVGANGFIPLIDGPVVELDNQMRSEPGQSSIKMIIQDDSIFLNRDETITCFENLLDHEIAKKIFSDFEVIATTDIDKDTPPLRNNPPPVVQRGTAMRILRSLAKRQGMHAYVLPGDSPGQSIGVFKPYPKSTDPTPQSQLPQLILLSLYRNIETFSVRKDAQRPSNVKASTIRIEDKSIISSIANFQDIQLLGEEASLEEGLEPATQILRPRHGESVDMTRVVTAIAEDSSYAIEATGSVLGDCYPGVLQPYQLVTVKAGDTPRSGDYLITKVTHSLTRSAYSQSFSLKGNAQSKRNRAVSSNPARRIF